MRILIFMFSVESALTSMRIWMFRLHSYMYRKNIKDRSPLYVSVSELQISENNFVN